MIGIHTMSFRRQLRLQAAMPAIDIALGKIRSLQAAFSLTSPTVDVNIQYLREETPSYIDSVARNMRDSGQRPLLMLRDLSLHPDAKVRAARLETVLSGLETARRLGAEAVYVDFEFHGRVARDGRVTMASELLQDLADRAGPGTLIVSENYDYFSSADFVEIYRRSNRPNLGFLNDIGNWLLTGEDPLAAAQRLEIYTRMAHVKNYKLEGGIFRNAGIATGDVRSGPVLEFLHGIAQSREGFIFSTEVDIDSGSAAEEDASIAANVAFLASWLRGKGVAL